MEVSKKFGPFTPQEFKQASEWLTKNNIPFTHFRDEEAEKRFSENTPENLVNQVEFRTQTYLGSIFYIESDMNPFQEEAFKAFTHLTPDQIPDKFKTIHIPETTHPEISRHKKTIWARIVVIGMIIYFIVLALRS